MPQVVYGYFPVNADGHDLIVWKDDDRTAEWLRFTYPRQRRQPYLCISDFFRPVGSAEPDYAAFHIVSMGAKVSEATARLFADNRYQDYLLLHGLGVEMAEALAEYWHARIRAEWGFGAEDGDGPAGPVPPGVPGRPLLVGLPGLPRPGGQRPGGRAARRRPHRRQLLGQDTSWQYQPEQTTSAIICHHPQAKYFVAR